MLEGTGRFLNRPTTTGGRKYDKFFIYIPVEVARDSNFPFREGEVTSIRIDSDNNRLIISKIQNECI